jgi:glyoxylase-like metal-dependent hydrolase (beta-lactamase superfamily II)
VARCSRASPRIQSLDTFSGYPGDWIGTLERLAALDPAFVVPGHGKVLQGKG